MTQPAANAPLGGGVALPAAPAPTPSPVDQANLLWATLLWTAIERLLISPPFPVPEEGAGPKMLLILSKVGLVTISATGKASLTPKGTKLLLDSAA